MIAVEWSNLGYAGTFVVGALAGTIATIRLAKLLAAFFNELAQRADRHRDDDEPER